MGTSPTSRSCVRVANLAKAVEKSRRGSERSVPLQLLQLVTGINGAATGQGRADRAFDRPHVFPEELEVRCRFLYEAILECLLIEGILL